MRFFTYLPALLVVLQVTTALSPADMNNPAADLEPGEEAIAIDFADDFPGYTTPASILSTSSSLIPNPLRLLRRGKPLYQYDDPLGCETSNASPPQSQVMTALNTILDNFPHNKHCRQENPFGSHCTKYRKNGEAAISVCGENPTPKGPTCKEVAEAAKIIAEKCVGKDKRKKGFGRAGGWYILFKWNVWVAVH